ncbi:Uncharacterised protein [uncultured archaeon]|nr:Uncharacterised protein [uncultured archaeon]
MILSKFDRVAILFALILIGLVFVSAGVLNTARPSHQLSTIGVGSSTIADNNIILATYGGTGVNGCTGDGNILYWNNTSKTWTCGSNANISGAPSGASLSGGIANTITKWLTSTTIGNSIITDDGTAITLAGKSAIKLILDHNAVIKIGSAYLNGGTGSGTNYAHFSNNAWFNGTAWTGTAPGALIQLANQGIAFFITDAAGNPTPTVTIGSTGILSATKGLVIETRTTDPASPVAGQMWLITS